MLKKTVREADTWLFVYNKHSHISILIANRYTTLFMLRFQRFDFG